MSRQLPALRGVAITLVVLHHSIILGVQASEIVGFSYTAWWGYIPLVIMKNLGIFAVPVFLFISGSFFAYTARGQEHDVSYKVVWSGLKNILPPYIFWSIMFYVMVYFLLNQKMTIFGYIKSLLVGYPYHFIPLIVFFYLISPLIVRWSKYSAWIVLLVIGLYQLFSLNVVFPGILGFKYPDWVRLLTLPVLRDTLAAWAIYFPLGVVYSLHQKNMLPFLQKYWVWFAFFATVFFVLAVLNESSSLDFSIASHIAPFAFIFVIPVIQRNFIPGVRQFEKIGKKAYGLYLTHLLLVNLVLAGIKFLAPGVISILLITIPVSFFIALSFPVWVIGAFERLPRLKEYRFVFG